MNKKILFIVTFCFCVANSFSQIVVSTSLEEAINKALTKSSSIKNKELEIEKLELQEKGVWNKYIPRIEANAEYLYFDNKLSVNLPISASIPIPGAPVFDGKTSFDNYGNIFNAGIIAKTILFTGLQIENGAKAIKEKTKGTEFLKEAEKDVIIKEVINTFDQLSLLTAIEKLINDSSLRLETETKRVTKAIEQGLAVPYDRDKIKLASLELDSKKIELEGKRKLVYKKLTYLTGYNPTEIEQVSYSLVPYIIADQNLSTENKQEIKALESFKSAYEFLLKKEKGTYLPTLGAFGGLTYSSLFDAKATTQVITGINEALYLGLNDLTISNNWIIGAGMKWELFAGFERKHKIHESKINIEQVQNQIDDTKEKLGLLLENNYVNYTVLNQKIDITAQQEKVAANNLKLAVKQYKEGLITISERLEAENDSFKSAVNKVNTIIEQRLAAIETVIATGELSKKLDK
ncbi:TolC family protein [Flavobacterium nackdongense]|uniref:TolC family protein n=1 Tax=Flavobacterium nackdongense TaxID=2547394 RepID=A0A4P6YCI3_9FLAO|nr:TolC family protein [Flavobacterium nackdongense]QBN18544.1 TolC family protein [Flavobacterium nackdongense]